MRQLIGLVLALAACGPQDIGTFADPVQHPDAAFLSVGGTGPDDLWLVGAQPGALAEPVVLRRRDGGPWEPVSTGQLHPLWWVHAFDGGPTFLAGGGATILRVTGDTIERTDTPRFFGNTVYGVWGSRPDDVWAVGGFAGRDPFAWRFDGSVWEATELPSDMPRTEAGEVPALFKVWGRGPDDVWAVGGLGTVLHFDGTGWRRVESGTREPLFTVIGDDDAVYAVGGSTEGVVIRGGLDGFDTVTPAGAPLLQGITVGPGGDILVAGASGFAARARAGRLTLDWTLLDLGFDVDPQSVHALFFDGEAVWGAGGGVLSPALDEGAVCTSSVDAPVWEPDVPAVVASACPPDRIDPVPSGSIARRWSELLLDSIRRDIPHPPVHARNIHHITLAMYDAWAAFDPVARGVVVDADAPASGDVDAAVSYAAYRVLRHRYTAAVGAETSLDCYDAFMGVLGLDPAFEGGGDDAASLGVRIGDAVIARFARDGANEAEGYADTTGWVPDNPVMVVDLPGTNVSDPDLWQQLNLGTAETQNGIVLDDSVQPYIGPHWRDVEPFALARDPDTGLYSVLDDVYPVVADPRMVDWVVQILRKTAELDIDDGVRIDVGPGAIGNNSLGADEGAGYAENPFTGQPYAPNLALRGDFTRVVAEMWADGPQSETPPGHWLRLGHEVSDRLPAAEWVPWGEGPAVDRLAWDVGLMAAIGAAVHDAAVSAWELKRDSLGPRPITLVRWMADRGQRSDPSLPSYDPDGLPLIPGLIELITPESSARGERHHALRYHVGEVAVWSWPGEPGDRLNDHTPLQWMRARDWIPYQRRTFVTPAFPGFTSGHSTFSRAAAEALTAYTGSPWFPGGLHEFVAPRNGYLKFEVGPAETLRLQWARYADAADQAGQSRLWGGIHVWPDDRLGRINGERAGQLAAARFRAFYDGAAP